MPVWTQDEAGPYQAIPQPGSQWLPTTSPARYPHEHIRHGTAKLLGFPHVAMFDNLQLFSLIGLAGVLELVGGILLNARDVSERKAFEAELTHQAFHDTVTGLAPSGVLRAALNLNNPVLVQGTPAAPSGVTVDIGREIAARLGISVRTVQTHLSHAYDKLGIHRRRDLPGALG